MRRKLRVSIVGVPKTMDNYLGTIDPCFGMETIVEASQNDVNVAHLAAKRETNGVGVVKLMGHNASHIALRAMLGSRDVDCCLIH